MSVDGDEFQGLKNISVYRPDATDYRPEVGVFTAGIDEEKPMPMGEDWVEHKDASAVS